MKMHKLEEIWLIFGIGVLAVALIVTGYQVYALGMGPPSHKETVDHTLWEDGGEGPAPFNEPGVYEVGDNQYEVIMTLEAFSFNPSEITVPKGAEVTFIMTSKDVVHGISVPHTNINTMVLPGHVQTITQTFNEADEYLMVCNEYCGVGHHMMTANIIVEE